MKMNKHYNELKASYLFVDIAHKVAAYQEAHPEKEIIRLGIGDVTQPLAKCVVDAMHDAVTEMGTKEGFHGYGPEQGYPFLKQAIQGYYAGRGTKLDEDEIFISDGAKSDLANVLGLFDVDNTVLVPDPVYPTYVDDNVTDGRKIIYGRTSQENGFLGMPDDSVKADIIYICSPNNPTGAAYTRTQLKAWVEYARKNNAIILYDAAYECFISDGELARSIFEIEGARECAIEICSFSKIAGFTGTRCGYTVVPKELERDGMNINKLCCAARPPSSTVCLMSCSAALPPSLPRAAWLRSSTTSTTTARTPRSSPTLWTSAACGTAAARTAPTSGCAAPAA